MEKYMPYGRVQVVRGGFESLLELLNGMTEKSDIGHIYEVDIT
jgi:hypothetical protein